MLVNYTLAWRKNSLLLGEPTETEGDKDCYSDIGLNVGLLRTAAD